MKLYEISNDIIELAKYIEMSASVDEEERIEVEEKLKKIEEDIVSDLENKLDSICNVISEWENDIAQIDNEIVRLKEMKNSKQICIDNLKEYTKYSLIRCGKEKVETSLHKISVKNNPPSIDIKVDVSELPEKYINTKIVTSPNKLLIKSDLKAGLLSEEEFNKIAELKTGDTRLDIK